MRSGPKPANGAKRGVTGSRQGDHTGSGGGGARRAAGRTELAPISDGVGGDGNSHADPAGAMGVAEAGTHHLDGPVGLKAQQAAGLRGHGGSAATATAAQRAQRHARHSALRPRSSDGVGGGGQSGFGLEGGMRLEGGMIVGMQGTMSPPPAWTGQACLASLP